MDQKTDDRKTNDRKTDDRKTPEPVKKNWLEWTVFIISAWLVAGVLGYLIYDGANAPNGPPKIDVTLGEPELQSRTYRVPVTVRNSGGSTAEGVAVDVELESGAETELATLDLDFIPRNGTRRGWVAFRSDPRAAGVLMHAYARSYQEP